MQFFLARPGYLPFDEERNSEHKHANMQNITMDGAIGVTVCMIPLINLDEGYKENA